MKTLFAALFFVLPALAFGGPATAAEYLVYDEDGSWAFGRMSYQFESPLGHPGAVGRSEFSLVHLEYRWPKTPLSMEAEVFNFSGIWTGPVDGVYSWYSTFTLPPVVLWWAPPFPDFPLFQAGPYLATGENLNLLTPEASTFRLSAGLRARLSAKLSELGGYRPYFTLNLGVDSKGQLVAGGSLELGALAAGILAILVLGAGNSAQNSARN